MIFFTVSVYYKLCKTVSYLFFEKNYFLRRKSKFAVLTSKAIEKIIKTIGPDKETF